jgi:hypothetical protein
MQDSKHWLLVFSGLPIPEAYRKLPGAGHWLGSIILRDTNIVLDLNHKLRGLCADTYFGTLPGNSLLRATREYGLTFGVPLMPLPAQVARVLDGRRMPSVHVTHA